ncbi:MAG TPA: mercuric reductase [Stenomitos sp.]
MTMSPLGVDSATVQPMDEFNQTLVSAVHPSDWINPTPADCYDLVVIGAGTAGLVSAAGAAGLQLGLRVALIEKHLMGGDCLNVGCVPSKCIIRSAKLVGELQRGQSLGIDVANPVQVDFAAAMARMRQVRAGISHHDSAQRFRDLGIDVFFGTGSFCDRQTIAVAGQRLRFKKAVIATGARAAHPNIPGLQEVGYLTNETLFSLTTRPQRLAVIGGGPIGCELAQAFRRLGSEVVMLHRGERLLPKGDPEAAALIASVFQQEGIQLEFDAHLERVEATVAGKRLHYRCNGNLQSVTVDEILVGVGRAPNVEGMNLEAAGITYDPTHGICVNDFLQTTNSRVYGAGDICMDWKFTHAADAAARLILKNMFFSPFGLGRLRLSQLVMPSVTFTDPEIAQVGLTATAAAQQGTAIRTITIPLDQVDRAIIDDEALGFVQIHHSPGSDQILGATVVARHGGEILTQLTAAMVGKVGLNKLSGVIHPYPTQSEGIKKAADAYRRALLTPRTRALLRVLTKLS